jgi:hypothetical protein
MLPADLPQMWSEDDTTLKAKEKNRGSDRACVEIGAEICSNGQDSLNLHSSDQRQEKMHLFFKHLPRMVVVCTSYHRINAYLKV